MPDIPKPWHSPDPEPSSKTFFGMPLKAFKALSHREQVEVIAKWDKKLGMKATYHKDPVFGYTWTTLKPTKKPRKK